MSPILYLAMVIIAAALGWGLVSAVNIRRVAMNEERLTKGSFIVFAIASAVLMAIVLLFSSIAALVTAVVSFLTMIVVLTEADRNIGVVSRRLGNNPNGKLSFRIWINPVAFVAIVWIISCERIVSWANIYNGFGLAIQALIFGLPCVAGAVVYFWAMRTNRQQVRTSDQPADQAVQPADQADQPEFEAIETDQAAEQPPVEATSWPAGQPAVSRGRHARPSEQSEDELVTGQTVLPVKGRFPKYKSRYEHEHA